MAGSTLLNILLPVITLFAISVSVSGRPCKTLFFYKTTSTSYYPDLRTMFSEYPNPNSGFKILQYRRDISYSPRFPDYIFTTVNGREDLGKSFKIVRLPFKFFPVRRLSLPIDTTRKELFAEEELEADVAKGLAASTMPLGFYSTLTRSSIRDRTRDIMNVVGALLFGVGCGALTAAAMYLLWSFFSPNRFEYDDSDDDTFYDIDDEGTPNKMGYMTIPDEDIDAVKKAAQAQALAKEAA